MNYLLNIPTEMNIFNIQNHCLAFTQTYNLKRNHSLFKEPNNLIEIGQINSVHQVSKNT